MCDVARAPDKLSMDERFIFLNLHVFLSFLGILVPDFLFSIPNSRDCCIPNTPVMNKHYYKLCPHCACTYNRDIEIHRYRETRRDRDTQTYRHKETNTLWYKTQRNRDTETQRHKDTERERKRDSGTERETERKRERERERERKGE